MRHTESESEGGGAGLGQSCRRMVCLFLSLSVETCILSVSLCVSLSLCLSVCFSLCLCPPCFSVPWLLPPCPKDTAMGTAGSRGDSRPGYHYMEDVQTCPPRPAASARTQTQCKSLTHLPPQGLDCLSGPASPHHPAPTYTTSSPCPPTGALTVPRAQEALGYLL